jgi:membrane-associated phospholipid phosphatase
VTFEGFRGFELRMLHAITCDFAGPLSDTLVTFGNDTLFGLACFLILGLVACLSPRVRARLPRVLVAAALTMALAHGLKQALWATWHRPRPGDLFTEAETLEHPGPISTCERHPEMWVKRSHAPDEPSFPSSHAITAGSVAVAITLLSPWVGVVAWLYAALVGYGRLYLGKHWPSDVVGGFVLAALLGWVAWRLSARVVVALQARRARRLASVRADAGSEQG